MTKLLKYKARQLTFALRHKPEDFALTVLDGGWVEIDKVLIAFEMRYGDLELIVLTDNKGRFSFSEDKKFIRANQGHSINIDLQLDPKEPPEFLYHGTVEKYMPWIKKEGLKKMSRNHVHLSSNLQTAEQVASRRDTKNVILEVRTLEMYNDGFKFFLSENGVWLTDNVPYKYIYRLTT
jgi:putative RNA 2'-phosphotransferase